MKSPLWGFFYIFHSQPTRKNVKISCFFCADNQKTSVYLQPLADAITAGVIRGDTQAANEGRL